MQFIFGRELNIGELYDRTNEVNTILNSYKTSQPIAVIGFRRVCKSSILNNVKYLLENNDVLVLKFSIEGISNLTEYLNRLIYSMLEES
jgi:AAA+ ATPase superfamily predicted ATPase